MLCLFDVNLQDCASHMSFYKLCFSQELNILTECSVALVRTWKVSGCRGRIYQNSNLDIKRTKKINKWSLVRK